MELIQIDSVKSTYAEADRYSYVYGQNGEGERLRTEPLLLDTDTGVVYFDGMQPRYDANGRVMIIPRDQLPGVIARARAQCSPAQALAAAKKAEEKRKRTITQV